MRQPPVYNPNLSQERCFMVCICSKGYVKGAPRRKQLIASFVEQFQLTIKNTRCFEFQFHVAKLSQ